MSEVNKLANQGADEDTVGEDLVVKDINIKNPTIDLMLEDHAKVDATIDIEQEDLTDEDHAFEDFEKDQSVQ